MYIGLKDVVSRAYDLFVTNNRMPDSVFYKVVTVLEWMSTDDADDPQLELLQVLYFFQQLFFAIRDNDYSVLQQQRGLKVSRVVGVEEFVRSKYYMNQARAVRPAVMRKLIELFESEDADRHVEVVLGGSIGWGKNYFTDMALGYLVYRLYCYHSPQLEFGLAPGSDIVFVFQSRTEKLAKKVAFGQFGKRLRESYFFPRYFPYNHKKTSVLEFPGNISFYPLASTDSSALGMNVLGGAIDELNFMPEPKKKKRPLTPTEVKLLDHAEILYTTIMRRMTSRFQVQGRLPGKLFLISSARHPNSFTERKAREAREDIARTGRSNIFYVAMSQWESNPAKYSKETFLVEVGNEMKSNRILGSIEEAIDKEDVIHPPVDLKEAFEKDLDGSVRDLAGISVGGSSPLIRRREDIRRAVGNHSTMWDGRQLFTRTGIEITAFDGRLWELVNTDYLNDLITRSAGTSFAAALDLGLTGDSAGLAIGHSAGFLQVGKSMVWNEERKIYEMAPSGVYPVVCIDGAIEIIPPVGDEIDLIMAADLLKLIATRLPLEYVTADGFQSAAVLQQIRKATNSTGRRISAWVMSVDTSFAPYANLKRMYADGRLLTPDHMKLQDEVRNLQLDFSAMKVDHPPGGSKDVADAVCAATFTLVNVVRSGNEASRYRDMEELLTKVRDPKSRQQAQVPMRRRPW